MTRLLALITGNPWVLVWIVVGTFAAGFASGTGAGWYVQSVRLDKAEAAHARYVAEAEANAAKAKQALYDQKVKWIKEKENAQAEADMRIASLQAELAATAAAAGKLRNTIGTLRSRLATASQPAVAQTADTLADVLQQCESEYRSLAEKADRHASDVQSLMDAWPR